MSLVIALVNNMPDGALLQTERQFADLLAAAGDDVPVQLRRYALPGIVRGPGMAEYVQERYAPLDALWDDAPDALIITGCEPHSPDLTREPYWPAMTQLLEWATDHVGSTIASCLAAHAALLHFDGVRRHRLPRKCSGVYGQFVQRSEPLATGLSGHVAMPHSRQNSVPTAALMVHQYRMVLVSAVVGWTVAVKERHGNLLVLMQGHPEYDSDTLLFEYRRDIRRFLRGERETYPALPVGYFSPVAERVLDDMRRRATRGPRDPELITQFPTKRLRADLRDCWRGDARRLYANWLAEVSRRSRKGLPAHA